MSICFDYQSPQGEKTLRRLTTYVEEGHYITGFDMDSGRVLTFRKDRIVQYHEDSAALLKQPVSPRPPRVERNTPPDLRPQIAFTGFAAALRADLERRSDAGGLRVVKGVTQGLVFLCAGPNAGPAKMAKARCQGVYVLSESDLGPLLETGELPDSALDAIA